MRYILPVCVCFCVMLTSIVERLFYRPASRAVSCVRLSACVCSVCPRAVAFFRACGRVGECGVLCRAVLCRAPRVCVECMLCAVGDGGGGNWVFGLKIS